MKLEADKTYFDRNRNKVTVVPVSNTLIYKFNGCSGLSYTEDGLIQLGCQNYEDLIEEYSPFEIGEELEFSNYIDFGFKFTRTLSAYCPNDIYPYKTSVDNYKYARRKITKLTIAEIEAKLGITNLEVIEWVVQ